ncbi:glutathione S-transferase [Komagataeibacter oboediens]|uniref:Glutathione S-transferase n=1 Tax=Komagataeibacter oboediens TaxID=65958 RepID=A0ABS5SNM5_9PROT|nr:glutathione S-transferase [Komagataeibacter oboediens]MBL7232164.1 glutathione S-transferase [Komagataeibacter oboediens]MBT0675793.1 glutathione S-transferase [Komagataeibacter oboediens]MBT0677843.1 glutathione S-transferase [Komagataeibacter oboediens]
MTVHPVLYSFRRCPYAMRARLALLSAGVECEIREVKLAQKPACMLRVSPKGTVPVLVLPDQAIIDESLDIMRWALGRHDPQHWLVNVRNDLIAYNDGPFKYHLDRYKYASRHHSDPMYHRAEALNGLERLDVALDANRFLHGDRPGLTDAAVAPFVRQFAATDPCWFATACPDGVQEWLRAFMALPVFDRAMCRLSPWREGDMPVLFD